MKVLSTLDLQQNRVINVGTAVDGSDLVTKAQLDAAMEAVKVKASCKTVATANITLSGEQTIGTTAVVAEDRVLVIGQTDAKTNGIYVVKAGAWERSADANLWSELVNCQVFVNSNRAIYRSDIPNTGTLGTDDVIFIEFLKYSELPSDLAKKYSGYIQGDGTTTRFNVSHNLGTPMTSVSVYENSKLVQVDVEMFGYNNIYVIFSTPPANGSSYDVIVVG